MTGRITWVITDGKAGHVTQAMGLADAMGFDTVEKSMFPAIPWRWLPASLWPRGVSGLGGDTDILSGTSPDLIISCGRHAVGPALWVKSRSQGHSFHIHVEHPRVGQGVHQSGVSLVRELVSSRLASIEVKPR